MDEMVDIIKSYSAFPEGWTGAVAQYIATGKDDSQLQTFSAYKPNYSTPWTIKSLLTKIKQNKSDDIPLRFYNMLTLITRINHALEDFFICAHQINMLKMVVECFGDKHEELLALVASMDLKDMKYNDFFFNTAVFDNLYNEIYKLSPKLLEMLLKSVQKPQNYFLRFYMLKKDYPRYSHIEDELIDDIAKDYADKANKANMRYISSGFFNYGILGRVADAVKEIYKKSPFLVIENQNIQEEAKKDLFISLNMNLAPLCAYYVNSNTYIYNAVYRCKITMDKYVSNGDYSIARRALDYADIHGKGLMYYYFQQNSQQVDIADWEKNMLIKLKDGEFKNWLVKGGEYTLKDTSADVLSIDDAKVSIDVAGLLGQSDIAFRFLSIALNTVSIA